VWVYAYNQADFTTANAGGSLSNAVAALNTLIQADAAIVRLPANSIPTGGGVSPTKYPAGDLETVCESQATWVTECAATSQAGVEVLATCNPLTLEGPAPTTCALPLELPDAGHSDQ